MTPKYASNLVEKKKQIMTQKHTLVIARFRVNCDQYFRGFSFFADLFQETLRE